MNTNTLNSLEHGEKIVNINGTVTGTIKRYKDVEPFINLIGEDYDWNLTFKEFSNQSVLDNFYVEYERV